MDFKAQLASDMKVFHNCGEMATMTVYGIKARNTICP